MMFRLRHVKKLVGATAAVAAVLVIVYVARPQDASPPRVVLSAIDGAVAQARYRLSSVPATNVAVLPVRDDLDDYTATALKSAVTRTHHKLAVHDSAIFREMVSQTGWNSGTVERLAPQQVKEFGKFGDVGALLYARIVDRRVSRLHNHASISLEVHLVGVPNGENLWDDMEVSQEVRVGWGAAMVDWFANPMSWIIALSAFGLCGAAVWLARGQRQRPPRTRLALRTG
jgi:hypothetical protein